MHQSCLNRGFVKMSSAFVCRFVIFMLLVASIYATELFEKIKAGFENARNYLQTARDIADLVSKSLKSKVDQNRRGDEAVFHQENEAPPFQPTNLITSFFRLLGLDSKKITAVAVNSFIFFAQMISEFFKVTPKIERAKSFDGNEDLMGPIRIITENENEKIKNLLKQAKNKHLTDQLINRANGPDSACVRLLLCKTSPVIWAAQKSLKNTSRNHRNDLTSWLPSKDEFEEYSDECDDKHKDCELNLDNL